MNNPSKLDENESTKNDLSIIKHLIRGDKVIEQDNDTIKRLFPDSNQRKQLLETNDIREKLIERAINMGWDKATITNLLDKMFTPLNT
uniref:Uncharacterized protein n=1 Tax=viral metagenome TaxID=1070528 RepID=A0A6C0L2P2_9ZZZZ|tara:strand:+ start:2734 stop:2997 length:264 start_codon:yes stop_codon:yes gene_type:complete